jgi:hypothetical protein
MDVQKEIVRAAQLGHALEGLVVKVGEFTTSSERDPIYMGYWSLILDYGKGIVLLLSSKFYGSAFALRRPIIEALVKSYVAFSGSEEDVEKIRQDKYKVSYEKDGALLDQRFGLGNLMDNFLRAAQKPAHSFTHSGIAQLARRFDGTAVVANYSDQEIVGLIRHTTGMVFLITILITKHFALDKEWKIAQEMYEEYGKS